eukprot:4902618-Amphidinium_carterae.1
MLLSPNSADLTQVCSPPDFHSSSHAHRGEVFTSLHHSSNFPAPLPVRMRDYYTIHNNHNLGISSTDDRDQWCLDWAWQPEWCRASKHLRIVHMFIDT